MLRLLYKIMRRGIKDGKKKQTDANFNRRLSKIE